jgi:tRNA A37 methylthiotransferase MiaB
MLMGVLGCMAERLKSKLLEEEKFVDIVVGPDAYRSLPELLTGSRRWTKRCKRFIIARRNLCRYFAGAFR